MLLYRARTHVEDRGDFGVGLARPRPLQHFALARGESRTRGRRRKIGLDGEADEEQKTAAARRTGHEPHAQRLPAPPDRERATRRSPSNSIALQPPGAASESSCASSERVRSCDSAWPNSAASCGRSTSSASRSASSKSRRLRLKTKLTRKRRST